MTDIVERLRLTTEQMANNCSVNMTLWCEHSGAALEAAAEIEHLRLRLSLSEARATGRREGLSEAAKIADKAAASSAISKDRSDVKTSSGNAIFTGHVFAETEAKAIAADIRAAMEKEE